MEKYGSWAICFQIGPWELDICNLLCMNLVVSFLMTALVQLWDYFMNLLPLSVGRNKTDEWPFCNSGPRLETPPASSSDEWNSSFGEHRHRSTELQNWHNLNCFTPVQIYIKILTLSCGLYHKRLQSRGCSGAVTAFTEESPKPHKLSLGQTLTRDITMQPQRLTLIKCSKVGCGHFKLLPLLPSFE